MTVRIHRPPAPPPGPSDVARDFPGYWFQRLENALTRGDFAAAAECAAELRRLGVAVNYPRPVFAPAMQACRAGGDS